MNYHRTNYEFDDNSNQPTSPIAVFIIISWIVIMIIGFGTVLSSCKAASPMITKPKKVFEVCEVCEYDSVTGSNICIQLR
jgi:hypothetical protein